MAFTSTFTANFDAFDRELLQAQVSLGRFEQDTTKVKKALQRMTSEFDGTKVISQANTMAEAVRRAGGASSLTANEMSRVSSAVGEALAKYQAMGQQAPAHLRVLQTQIKALQADQQKATASASEGTKQTGLWGQAFGSLKGAAAGFAAGFGVASIVSSLTGAVSRTIAYAGAINDLSARVNVSTTALQRWEYAAKLNGNTLDELVTASDALAKRLGEGDKSTVAAVAKLGLNFETLRAQSPEKTFEQIAARLATVKNAYEQAALTTDLFGRAGQAVLPTLKANLAELGDEAGRIGAVLNEETVKAMDDLGDAMTRGQAAGKGLIAQVLTPVVPLLNAVAQGAGLFAAALAETAKQAGRTSWFDLMQAAALIQAKAGLTPPPNKPFAVNAPLDTRGMDQASVFVRRWTEEAKKAEAAAAKLLSLQDQLYGGSALKKASEYAQAIRHVADVEEFTLGAKQDLARVMLAALEVLDRSGKGATTTAARYRELALAAQRTSDIFAGFQVPNLEEMAPAMRELMDELRRAPLESRPLPVSFGGVSVKQTPAQRESFFQAAFGTSEQFGAALSSTIIGAVQGGGSVSQAIGGLFGQGAFSQLGKMAAKSIGGMLGGALGSVIPGLGTLLGSGLGSLAGKLFGGLFGGEGKKTNKMRDQWLAQAGGLDQVRKMADYAGVSIDRLITTGKTKTFEAEVKRLEAAFKATQERVQKLTGELQTLGQRGGLVTASLWQRLGADRNKDEVKEALQALAGQQTTQGVQGISGFVAQRGEIAAQLKAAREQIVTLETSGGTGEVFARQLAEAHKQAEKLTRQMDALALTESGAAAVGTTIASMAQALEEQGATPLEAMQQLGPTIERFREQLGAAGLGGGEAFDQIVSMARLASDEIAGPVLSATSSLGQSMVSLQNMGLLNQDTFAGLTEIITGGMQSLIAQGHSAEDMIALNRGGLQQIWQLQREFGFTVDDTTQSLLDQAAASGQVGEKFLPPIDRLIARLDTFIDRLMGGVAGAAETAAGGLVRAFDGLQMPTVRVPITYEGGDLPPGVPSETPSFARGSFGLLDFGRETLARLHGKEAILTESQLNDFLKTGVATLGAAPDLAALSTQLFMPLKGASGSSVSAAAVNAALQHVVGAVTSRAATTAPSGPVTFDFTINALDSRSVREATADQIVPILVDLLTRNARGSRTDVRGALGVA